MLAAKCAFYASAGTVIRIESPGGGGWGKPNAPQTAMNLGTIGSVRNPTRAKKDNGRKLCQSAPAVD